MALTSGTKLGPYEIQSPLGAGGMGEVYRARDTRLGREVAIKVLPQHLSSNPDLKARFEREARTISSLNHPHICHLYDIGSQNGIDYLVMEYLEGETLDHRLTKGPLPLKTALEFGVQICEALEKAHRAGFVHRDLKPGNIMLTASGAKLLDFGLARVMKQPGPAIAGNPQVATESMRLTQEGVIIGTWQYMAPEQVEGDEADARTDIFALGTVLYEMATGRPAFAGKTKASLIAAILSSEPPAVVDLQSMSSAALDHAVRKCLEKDPQERWQSAHDLKSELQWIAHLPPEAGGLPATAAQPRFRKKLVILTAALAMIGLLWMGFAYWQAGHVAPPAVVRFSIAPPEKTSYDGDVALSPDGRWLAFGATGPNQDRKIWLRPLGSELARPLPGTENANIVFFWSPDSRYIGFFRDGKLKSVDLSSGFPEDLCAASGGLGASWADGGVILFGAAKSLQRIDLADCAIKPATNLVATRQENTTAVMPSTRESAGLIEGYPNFLPDGRHFLFVARSTSLEQVFDIYVSALDSQESRLLIHNGSSPFYAPPGYLAFARDGKLFVVAFDSNRQRTTGEPFPMIDEQVEFSHGLGFASYSISQDGVLAYEPQVGEPNSQLRWFDRAGKQIGLIGEADLYQRLHLSPDGKRIAVARIDRLNHTGDFWIYEIARHTWTRFTFHSTPGGGFATWSADGRRIAYRYGGPSYLFARASDGSGAEETLLQDGALPDSWSPDGRYLVYELPNLKTGKDLWVLPLFGDRKPISFLQTPFDEVAARISPDGRWMAYESNESGRWEIYVLPFLHPGPKLQVSSGGVTEATVGVSTGPKWSSDGKELFYVSADEKLMSVPVKLRPTFQMDTPHALFTLPVGSEYEPSPDRQRFLVLAPSTTAPPAPITVVLNWTTDLKPHK
jgi:eukaryotic-like serine/threonine-protein kinase